MPDGLYFNAPLTGPGDYFEWTVPSDAPAEIPFFCGPHCNNGMTGTIYVETQDPVGNMSIGFVNIINPEPFVYYLDHTEGQSLISIHGDGSLHTSFKIGVEIEENDIDVNIEVLGTSNVYIYQASTGTTTALSTGTYTLTAMEKYLFHADASGKETIVFTLSWEEVGNQDDVQMSEILLYGNGSINSFHGQIVFSTSTVNQGSALVKFSADVDSEMLLGVLGNVSSSTLTLPPNGEEGMVAVPAGVHEVHFDEISMLWIPDSGDDGDGSMPEDVNGDGVVDVSDLLAIIAAWGQTSP
jgi:hypothetical protein